MKFQHAFIQIEIKETWCLGPKNVVALSIKENRKLELSKIWVITWIEPNYGIWLKMSKCKMTKNGQTLSTFQKITQNFKYKST
jgi:hypothetical protein